MKLKPTIRNCFASLLIVVFSLQAGTGLYLHDYLHVKKSFCVSANSGSKEIKLACSCISDFYLPFTQVAQQKICTPLFEFQEQKFFYNSPLLFTTDIYHSLRAPPFVA